jgi:hypothetical protein
MVESRQESLLGGNANAVMSQLNQFRLHAQRQNSQTVKEKYSLQKFEVSQFTFSVGEYCSRIQQEFQYLERQCNTLRIDLQTLKDQKVEFQEMYQRVSILDRFYFYL